MTDTAEVAAYLDLVRRRMKSRRCCEKGGHGVDVIRLFRLAAALDVSLLTLLDVHGSPITGADRSEGLPS